MMVRLKNEAKMDEKLHSGLLWEKVAELNLPERALIDSFDSEMDFVNYMNRAPLIAWESVKGTKLDKIKAKAKDEGGEKKENAPTLDDIKKKAKDLDEDDAKGNKKADDKDAD